jgi:hypothetical protein
MEISSREGVPLGVEGIICDLVGMKDFDRHATGSWAVK